MNVFEAICERRIRAFKEGLVSDETVETLIGVVRWVPSAGNIQPWEFIITRGSETRRRIAEAALDQTFIKEAPLVIAVCANENCLSQGYGARSKSCTVYKMQLLLYITLIWLLTLLGWTHAGLGRLTTKKRRNSFSLSAMIQTIGHEKLTSNAQNESAYKNDQ